MTDHYYSQNPHSEHEFRLLETVLLEQALEFKTDKGVFSRGGIDFGSRLLIESFYEQAVFKDDMSILELGVGYGPILISLAKKLPNIHMTGIEINERAFTLAEENARRNHVKNIAFLLGDVAEMTDMEAYDYVLTNPPIRAGKAVIQQFVQKASAWLKPGGSLWLVIQKKQGAPSMRAYMEEYFAEVDRLALKKGYWILKGKKV